jgi:hypothetical protein
LRTELGISKGLSANSFAQDVLAQSGYAKMMDSIETLDLNEDDREVLRYFEYELFDMMKLTLDSLPNVPKITGELQSFEFGILDFPQNATDIWLDREKEYQYGISTPLDWLRETRPDLSDEELLKVISENVKIKNTTIEVKAAGRIESILSRLNAE